MNKVKTRELRSHIFKQECLIYDDEKGSLKEGKFDCTLTNDRLGTTLSFIKGNEQIIILMEQIFKKLGFEVEI